MSASTVTALEFEVLADEASIRLAAEKIRRENGRADAILKGRDQWSGTERRTEQRGKLILGAFLTPVLVEGDRVSAVGDQPQVPVLTQNISPHGIAFRHDSPTDAKHGVLEFALWVEGLVELLVEIRWTRRCLSSAFSYESGCKILGVIQRSGSAPPPSPGGGQQTVQG
jgi:hypothetical protein